MCVIVVEPCEIQISWCVVSLHSRNELLHRFVDYTHQHTTESVNTREGVERRARPGESNHEPVGDSTGPHTRCIKRARVPECG